MKTAARILRFEHVWAAALFLVYLFLLLRAPLSRPDEVWGGYDMGHQYPFKAFWIESLKMGDPAWWNPFHGLGMPFASHPLVGAFSPFNVFFFLFPGPLAFDVNTFAHFFIAAFGCYYFLRKLGSGWGGGFLAGMAYAFCAFFMTHSYQGQAPLMWAASWAPWALHFLIRALDEKKLFPLMLSAACLCLSALEGYPQVVYYILLLQAFYFLRHLLARPKDGMNTILSGLLLLGGFVALTACLVLPSAQFIALSNRWDWGYSQIMTDYLAPNRLEHFFNPDFLGNPFNIGYTGKWGYHEIVNYIGLVPLVLFLAGVFWFGRVRLYGWFLSAAVLFTVLSLGDSTPLSKWVFKLFFDTLPGFSHNRSIGRMMVIPCFVMACAAGLVFDAWTRREKQPAPSAPQAAGWTRFLFSRWSWLPAAALALTVIDLWLFGARFVGTKPPPSKFDILPGAALEEVLKDPSYPRVAQSVDTNANLLYRVRGLFSTDRTHLKDMEDFLQIIGSSYNTPLADLSRVKYLYNKSQGASDRWENLAPNIYRNKMVAPPAFLAGGYEIMAGGSEAVFRKIRGGLVDVLSTVLLAEKPKGFFDSQPGTAGTARITRFGNNLIEVDCQADRPCLLFLSEQYYPGWKASVDGKAVPVLKADGVFRAVPLAKAGSHKVVVAYRPWQIVAGVAVSAAAWLLLVLLGWKRRDWTLDVNMDDRFFSLVRAVFGLPNTNIHPTTLKLRGTGHETLPPQEASLTKIPRKSNNIGNGEIQLEKQSAFGGWQFPAAAKTTPPAQLKDLARKIGGRFTALLKAVFGLGPGKDNTTIHHQDSKAPRKHEG